MFKFIPFNLDSKFFSIALYYEKQNLTSCSTCFLRLIFFLKYIMVVMMNFFFFLYFEIRSYYNSPVCPWTLDLPASTSQRLGLQTCAMVPSLSWFYFVDFNHTPGWFLFFSDYCCWRWDDLQHQASSRGIPSKNQNSCLQGEVL
jgi:hypothetical protein